MGSELLPIGRRVAYWRGRRRMSQQVFADRLGKSKSWVDKVERGARSLDKVSTLQDIAAVLRIDRAVLLGRDAQPALVDGRAEGVDRVRAALSTYETALGRRVPSSDVPSVGQVARSVGHAWTTYQHARYPQLMGVLPDLVIGAQRCFAREPGSGRVPLVETYRVAASLLVKLGEAELAWLAADRAMAVATGDRVLVAAAAVQLGQVLRATGRARSAVSTMRAAAYRIAPPDLDGGPPSELSLCGTLLVQAALAAARSGDDHGTADLMDEAADLAARVGDGHDHHRTAFGPTAVAAARTVAAVELGDAGDAVAWHEKAVGRDGWRWLPAEHRAAHLLDAARAHLQADDPAGAARMVLDADRTAPAEVRHRPAAREVLARVARHPDAPATIVPLAAALGVC
ncbi:Transcriptional regulator, contains XRE-family HTH domain [Micromonospora nigra]|uniref:Transcriptional regulator, contains XRE-family HTH domain n=1 Tax=Micromonospora nigra TaxID=145857 RepID=A0A1C6S3C6_9ACTN|nr:helix-turn-helix domain-containing protein [Micromonospora nigra]SCL23886.1 Transcriptional regulator, contains XRE-family HTH domain [Micromonospora nigra]